MVPGGATFYAPRVGVDVVDRSGTVWPLPDFQVDYHLPRLCGVRYTGADGRPAEPVVIHRTLLGWIERFVAALLEQHGITGLPDWLKPMHLRVLPVREEDETAARALADALRLEGTRAAADDRRGSLGCRSPGPARTACHWWWQWVPTRRAPVATECVTAPDNSHPSATGLAAMVRRLARTPDPSLGVARPSFAS